MSTPVVHIVAGPNGAGKTTFVLRVLQPVTHLPFVNADVIAAERWPDAQSEHAYDASRAAEAERQRLMARRVSFITETVFSQEKIRKRYDRLWDLIAQATTTVSRADFYDNSRADTPFRSVATYGHARPTREPSWPTWTPAPLRPQP